MAKLIPGKLRMEGAQLYETSQIEIIKEKDHRLYARVADEEIRYSWMMIWFFVLVIFSKKRVLCAFGSTRALPEK